jgi:nitrite reductase/ring-hydroxylating ferredoxin subunit
MPEDLDGSAYNRRPETYMKDLTEVGRGTPMGELMRRYWHPVGLSSHATDIPREVRALGEDLVLFRDREGRPGLMYNRCCHRGTTLYYGRVEDRGIRCSYHGWLFDVEGRCLEQPCEPDMGVKFRDKIRQPWYPVKERYGLIFAYMGPPEKIPVLPRYECLENLAEDEYIAVDDTSLGTEGDVIMPCNWLQHFENMADPYHLPTLHLRRNDQIEQHAVFIDTGRGVVARPKEPLPNGQPLFFISEAVIPTIRVLTNPFVQNRGLGWMLPIDDTHFRNYQATRMDPNAPPSVIPPEVRKIFNDVATWKTMTREERRNRPGDWEAQTGQGEITLHSEEHLVSSDRGIVMVRKMLRDQLDRLARGEDPINVSFDPDTAPIKLIDGDWKMPAPAPTQ